MVPRIGPGAARLAQVTAPVRSRAGSSPRDLLAVFVGGLIGTSLRVLLDVVGAFVLGLLVAALWPRVPGWVRVGLGPGILGSFTTFSALAVSIVALAQAGDVVGAILSIVLSIGFGMLAAWLGLVLGARLAHGGSPAAGFPGSAEVDE